MLDKNYFCMWACWIFLIEFCLLRALLKRNIWICLWNYQTLSNHFETNMCALQATRPYSHSASHDDWHVKYFYVLLKNFSSYFSSSWFILVVQDKFVHDVKQIKIIDEVCGFEMQSLQRRVQYAACVRLSPPTPTQCGKSVCWSEQPTFGYIHWTTGPIHRNIARTCSFPFR